MRGAFWFLVGFLVSVVGGLGTAASAYAAPVDFGALDGTFGDLAGDLIPTVGSLLGSMGGLVLIPLALMGVAVVFGLIWAFRR